MSELIAALRKKRLDKMREEPASVDDRLAELEKRVAALEDGKEGKDA